MINIQAEVEKPFLYIMARCPSNKQQFLYVEERIKDILNLNEDLALLSGIKIHDVFRFLKVMHQLTSLKLAIKRAVTMFVSNSLQFDP